MTQEEKDLAQIERFIRDSVDDRLFAKAMADAEADLAAEREDKTERAKDPKEDAGVPRMNPDDFPATREGFHAFLASAPMRRLMVDDLDGYKRAGLTFIEEKELPKKGEVTAEDVSAWVQRVDLWQATSSDDRKLAAKAIEGRHPRPTPWKHTRTLQGLTEFAKSDPMQTLKRESMGDWTQCVLDFLTSIPRITPKQISEVRLRLESTHPDRQFVKGLGDLSNQLTSGQSVLMKNFGADLADPDRWMIPR